MIAYTLLGKLLNGSLFSRILLGKYFSAGLDYFYLGSQEQFSVLVVCLLYIILSAIALIARFQKMDILR